MALRGLRFVGLSKEVDSSKWIWEQESSWGFISGLWPQAGRGVPRASLGEARHRVASVGLRAEQRYLRVHVAQKH